MLLSLIANIEPFSLADANRRATGNQCAPMTKALALDVVEYITGGAADVPLTDCLW